MSCFGVGNVSEAQKLLEGSFGDYLVQMYLPLANLKIRMNHLNSDCVSRYNRVLKLDSSIHTISYILEGKRYTREYL